MVWEMDKINVILEKTKDMIIDTIKEMTGIALKPHYVVVPL